MEYVPSLPQYLRQNVLACFDGRGVGRPGFLSPLAASILDHSLLLSITMSSVSHFGQLFLQSASHAIELSVNPLLPFLVFSLDVLDAVVDGLLDRVPFLLDRLLPLYQLVVKALEDLRADAGCPLWRIIFLLDLFLLLPFSSLSNSSSFFSAFTKQSDR